MKKMEADMRFLKYLVTILILVSCSTKHQTWDSGAQKQEAMKDETKQEQMERLRYQFPGGHNY